MHKEAHLNEFRLWRRFPVNIRIFARYERANYFPFELSFSGVVDERLGSASFGGSSSTLDLVSAVWTRLKTSRQFIPDIEATFTRIEPRYDVTVDNVVESRLFPCEYTE